MYPEDEQVSQGASGYDRIEGDRYYTPAWVTEALLSVEKFHGGTIDPAAGAGHIVDAFTAFGLSIEGTDIDPDAIHVRGPLDYLSAVPGLSLHNIVTNPPYGKGGRLAVSFIEKALADTEAAGGKVAMLLRIDFDSANGRRKVFGDHPAFAAKYALTKRIRWANLPQSDSGPTDNHAWFVWDWSRRRDSARAYGYLP
jgi:hypothetical protein